MDMDYENRQIVVDEADHNHWGSGSAISHAVGLENKLFSLTVEHPTTDAAAESSRAQMSIKKEHEHILGGLPLIQTRIARTLSLMVVDLTSAGREAVKKVRDNVKYVKLSASHEEKFLLLTRQLQIPCVRTLILDDQAQWNTTYEMLVAALELKQAFSCLNTFDPDYKVALNMEEWKQVETLCTFMKLFYDTAKNVYSTPSNCYFYEIARTQNKLPDLAGMSGDDPFVSSFLHPVLEKFDKLWKDLCLSLAAAAIIDPRFKMKLVEFSFSKIYGEQAGTYIKLVDDEIRALFHEYEALPLPLTPTCNEEGNLNPNCNGDDNSLADFDAYITKINSQQSGWSELDTYIKGATNNYWEQLDLPSWWNRNKTNYPRLSKMALYILSIPMLTLAGDAVFHIAPK